jgi:hypothetical protein
VSKEKQDQLRQRFLAKAEVVFEEAIGCGEGAKLTLVQMEETVAGLKFELTSLLLASMIEMQAEQHRGPGPVCAHCGGEMYSKGIKRRWVVTSQGEIELGRTYNYCDQCKCGLFPPG